MSALGPPLIPTTPTAPSHPFFTVCFPLVLSVCTCFHSLSPPTSPSLSEDLTFFPLSSHSALTGAFVTRHPLSLTEHSVLPLSFFFSFSHSLHFWLPVSSPSVIPLCLVVVPRLIHVFTVSLVVFCSFVFFFPSLLSSLAPSLSFFSPVLLTHHLSHSLPLFG